MVAELYSFGNLYKISSKAICNSMACSNGSKIIAHTAMKTDIRHIASQRGSSSKSGTV